MILSWLFLSPHFYVYSLKISKTHISYFSGKFVEILSTFPSKTPHLFPHIQVSESLILISYAHYPQFNPQNYPLLIRIVG